MADIHILTVDQRPNGVVIVEVVYHVVVPAAIQPPGSVAGLYPIDTSRTTVLPSSLEDPVETTAMQNGTLFEEVRTWRDNVDARTKAQIRDAIRANWNVVQTDVDARLLEEYAFFGQTFARI